MPKSQDCLIITEYLDTLEDTTLFTKKSRKKCFKSLKSICDENGTVTHPEVKRILSVFMDCMKEDVDNLPHAITAISSLLRNVKIILRIPVQDLLPSALALLHMLKTLCVSNGTETLREMSLDLFLSYPQDVLNTMVVYNCSEILEIFDVYGKNVVGIKVNRVLCDFLHKFLNMLSPEQKLQFVSEGTAIWFKDFVPTVMNMVVRNDVGHDIHLLYVECFETLADTLVNAEYFETLEWKLETLQCICNTEKYPLIMKNLLQKGSKIWHRLWIVFVKLLKSQLTSNCGPHLTPINAMLPVVELGFKLDMPTRCRALKCWDSLIDNFSKETKKDHLPRRIKLLMTPLKLNNAKTEETAMAKFNTWWNMIRKFDYKLDSFINDVLISFIHFAFGKEASQKKPALVGAGQLYESVGELSLQAFAQLLGHLDSDCCTALPKLNRKILNNQLMASHWTDLMSALKATIMMHFHAVKKRGVGAMEMNSSPVSCVWKAFFIAVAELPPNGVRWDMFNGLFEVLNNMTENCYMSEGLSDILFALTLSILKDDVKIQEALIAKTKGEEPLLHKVILIITHPRMHDVCKRCGTEKVVEMLKPLTNLIVKKKSTNWLLYNLTHTESAVQLWTALLHSVQEFETVLCPVQMHKLLEWPIKSINEINVDKYASIEWSKAYSLSFEIINKQGLETGILECISKYEENKDKRYFILCLTICLLKIKLINGSGEDAGSLPNILQNLTSQMNHYKGFEQVVPMLVDTVVVMINNVMINENEKLAEVALNCVKNILKIFFSEIKSHEHEAINPLSDNICMMLTNLFDAVDLLFKFPLYSDANCDFINKLREHALPLSKECSLFKFILSKMKTLNGSVATVKNNINDSIVILEGTKKLDNGETSADTNKNVKEFTSPAIKKVVKRIKKKGASVVNTVEENGEEYLVVKSNWKFNPRKLTENQKEKFQRKREDIPALYQDLSQSQDEFKLKSWKTNSQDATTSNSKSENSTSNDNALCILKNISNSDVVPTIMEKILSENDKNCPSELNTRNGNETKCDLVTDKPNREKPLAPSTPKNTKSPRMALKDRVFRNVRNLIEKSSLNNNSKELPNKCQTENVPKTPQSKPKINSNIFNSAPPSISTDRPARVKRTPKKFDDVKLFASKRCRRLQTEFNLHSQNEADIIILNEMDMDGDVNIDKSILPINNINTEIDQETVKQNEAVEIKDNVESLQDVPESGITPVTQHEVTKVTLDEPIAEDICETRSNDDALDIHNNVDTQDDKNKNASKKVDDKSITVEKHCEIENNKNETVISKKPKDSENYQTQSEIENNEKETVILKTVNKHKESTQNEIENNKNETVILISPGKKPEKTSESEIDNKPEEVILKTPVTKPKETTQKSTTKKSDKKKSRIEKELAIDMVEGHPFLKVQSEKRSTRKKLVETEGANKRKSVTLKLNINKSETKISPKSDKKSKNKDKLSSNSLESSSVTVEDTQEITSSHEDGFVDDALCSEDVIESSQDSTLTTISVKSTKLTSKRLPIVSVERIDDFSKLINTKTQDLLQDSCCDISCVTNKSLNQESKDDIELPQNKTAEVEKNQSDLTENMDTEPAEDDVIIINDDDSPMIISSEKSVGPETQELAEADTQPNDPADFVELETTNKSPKNLENLNTPMDTEDNISINTPIAAPETQENVNEINSVLSVSLPICAEKYTDADTDVCSPFKDDTQRKQDFLNNTSEISPIKVQSPDREKTSPPQENGETSSDYLVVKLSMPVQSNGEPFDKSGSPEFFTDDKISPDKRDQSPPRVEVSTSSGSPSSSLSLKKNRTQVLRPMQGGRAAHMLGLCVPSSLNTIKNSERFETDEPKKGNTSTPARRNLRVIYNAVTNANGDNNDNLGESEEHDNFLKFKKALPSTDSSPSVPILKRKLIDIVDDTTASPASKRKRVSFHDPPVSTTVSVQKYIEPSCIKSPSSAHKRVERPVLRSYSKSPKRLENTFVKLDTVLSKAVESFTEEQANSLTNDTNASLDVTPAVEVVNTSELNDTDPICPDLVDCMDSIENIATELSSPAMKDLLIKELEGKVGTVGDLAKMTELEVNRLCIKAPKIQIAKKVLTDYVNKKVVQVINTPETMNLADDTSLAVEINEDMNGSEAEPITTSVETQTNQISVRDMEVQTRTEIVKMVSTQTNMLSTAHTNTQTVETGSKTTSEIISSCLNERDDFVERLSEQLEETSIRKLSEKLSTDSIIDVLVKKFDDPTSKLIFNELLDRQSQNVPNSEKKSKEFSVLKDFLCERFDSRDLILFCSRLLHKMYDENAS